MQELQRAGYATDPQYARKVAQIARQMTDLGFRPSPPPARRLWLSREELTHVRPTLE